MTKVYVVTVDTSYNDEQYVGVFGTFDKAVKHVEVNGVPTGGFKGTDEDGYWAAATGAFTGPVYGYDIRVQTIEN